MFKTFAERAWESRLRGRLAWPGGPGPVPLYLLGATSGAK